MEVMKILDELEDLVAGSTRIPMTGKVLIDDEVLFQYIDKLRAVIPEEMREAKRISQERERVVKEAEEQADRLLKEAKNYVAKMANETEVAKKAKQQAEEILQQARKTSLEMKESAKDYADDVLKKLEINLDKALAIIRQGRVELKKSQ